MFKNWMSQISLYKRIQLSFLLLILLPFAVVTFNSYQSIQKNVMQSIEGSNANVLDLISDQLSQLIDSISFSSVYFSNTKDSQLMDSLRVLSESQSFSNYENYYHYGRINYLSSILMIQTTDAEMRLFLLNPSYQLIAGNLEQPVFSEVKDAAFRQAARVDIRNDITLQWFYVKDPEKGSFYYAARVIKDPVNNEHLATMFIGIPQSYFDKLFGIPGGGVLSLYDPEGTKLLSNREGPAPEPDGMIRSETVIPKVGWRLVYETPRSQVAGQITKEFAVSAYTIGGFFLVFLLFSMYLAKSIHTPVLRMRETAKEYVRGNRSVRLPVTGKDEMALLATAFNKTLDDINRLIEQVEQEQEEKRVLELEALFSQIRPHFLLNTLNSIKVKLIMSGDKVHSPMMEALISLLRAYVRSHEPASLAEECKLLDDYLQVMQIRSQFQVEFRLSVPEELAGFRIPRLLLQPIVENAVIHGFALHPEDARVELQARIEDDVLTIAIEDNGRGMTDGKLAELNGKLRHREAGEFASNRGVGLVNIARRLKLSYGPGAELLARHGKTAGCVFVLRIPLQDDNKEEERHV
ncbi:sensor histidine kinase [Gorillibacterium sp. sgz5001074]|uniref:sensor histidine kinase n=1 Tax=Gorillibacterium sp. sgz5001074 TaxID=3446695 RepID=UPI003F66B9E1